MILLIGDSHWGVRNGSKYYLEKVLNVYKRAIDIIKSGEVTAVFHLGDFFDDRREINIYTMNLVTKLLVKLDTFNIPFYFLLGNHDVFYKNDNSINSITPIFSKYNNLHVIDANRKFEMNGIKIASIPWINSSNVSETSNFINDLDSDYIILGHFGFSELTSFSKSQDLININHFKRFKKVYSGHYHLRMFKENITYIGSVTDFKWGEEFTPHGFLLLDKNLNETWSNNEENCHHKFLVENKKDLAFIIDKCKNKEIKIVLMNELDDITAKEYDIIINEINKLSHSVNIIYSNDLFIDSESESEVNVKSFEEFMKSFINTKKFDADIKKNKLLKVLMNLYKSVQ